MNPTFEISAKKVVDSNNFKARTQVMLTIDMEQLQNMLHDHRQEGTETLIGSAVLKAIEEAKWE